MINKSEEAIRKDERKRIGKALRKFIDDCGLEIAFLAALNQIVDNLARGGIGSS